MSIPTSEIYRETIQLLPDLGWRELLIQILNGTQSGLNVGSNIWRAYAPMMIPMFDSGGLSRGLFSSWGLRNRDSYYCLFSSEDGIVQELARHANQFMLAWTKDFDGYEEEIVLEMATAIGFSEPHCLISNFRNDTTFRHVPEMNVDRPISLLREEGRENEYNGQAPCLKNLDEVHVRTWTVGETNSEPLRRDEKEALLPAVLNSGFAPPWFLTQDQQTVFYKLLRAGDHQGAWMSLNSSQWTMEDARRAITELAKEVELPLFREFAKAWAALPFPDDWWY